MRCSIDTRYYLLLVVLVFPLPPAVPNVAVLFVFKCGSIGSDVTLVGVDVACCCCCWASAAEAEAGAKVRNGVGAASDL
jgi:hypothetical protein